MTYSTACETLGFTTPKTVTANAKLARTLLATLTASAPLKMKVAATVLIRAAK